MRVYLGADHGGFELKERAKEWLSEWGYEYVDLGNLTHDPGDDYPDFAFKVAEAVGADSGSLGVVLCRSSQGVVVAANKVKGVRAASVFDVKGAKHARNNDDINVLGLSGDWLSVTEAREVIKVFLETPFSKDARHVRRVEKIESYERNR